MTTATIPTKKSKSSKSPRVTTLGPIVTAWIQKYLVHGAGDYLGQPFRLRRWQKQLVNPAYRLRPDGSRLVRRAVWGLPKGNAKTELAAALAVTELAGPVTCTGWKNGRPIGTPRLSPDIPVAAASFEQADLIFAAAKAMIEHGPLAPYFDCFDTEILPKDRPGRLYRVAAMAGTNDGLRPSFSPRDELHEWTGRKERVHLVLSNGLAKRKNTWSLDISTAGWDITSLLGRLYQHGQHVLAGDIEDEELHFVWYQASEHWDLTDPEQLDQALKEANPAIGDFLPLEGVRARFHEILEFEARRYYLNQWTSAPDRWFPVGAFAARTVDRVVAEGERVTLGFDGSWSGDSTALVGCTLDRHLFVIEAWESDGTPDWRVDVLDVEESIRAACRKYDVVAIGCDPYLWQRTLTLLAEEGLPVVEWPSHTVSRMVPACTQFYEGVTCELLTHDGDERLVKHVANCVVKIDSRGPRIVKEQQHSPRKIDLAVAAVIADDMSIRQESEMDGLGVDFGGRCRAPRLCAMPTSTVACCWRGLVRRSCRSRGRPSGSDSR